MYNSIQFDYTAHSIFFPPLPLHYSSHTPLPSPFCLAPLSTPSFPSPPTHSPHEPGTHEVFQLEHIGLQLQGAPCDCHHLQPVAVTDLRAMQTQEEWEETLVVQDLCTQLATGVPLLLLIGKGLAGAPEALHLRRKRHMECSMAKALTE